MSSALKAPIPTTGTLSASPGRVFYLPAPGAEFGQSKVVGLSSSTGAANATELPGISGHHRLFRQPCNSRLQNGSSSRTKTHLLQSASVT
jgi:hypothetical protein